MKRGVGIYIRQLSQDRHGTPEDAARRASEHGVRWVAIMSVWQGATAADSKIVNKPNTSKYADYVHAFKNAGIDVWLWGYPWQGKEQGFCTRIKQAMDRVPGLIDGIILDPEKGYKWDNKGVMARTRSRAIAAVVGTLDLLTKRGEIGVTSYGSPKMHPNFPWDEFVAGFGSPQFYTVGEAAIQQGVQQWRDLGFTSIVPSVPAYGDRADDLDLYLSYFNGLDADGFLFWSWRQLTPKKWKAVERCAAEF